MNDYPEVMTVEQARHYLQIGRNKIYDLIKSGEIPSIRVGKSIRVLHEDVLAYTQGKKANDGEENSACEF